MSDVAEFGAMEFVMSLRQNYPQPREPDTHYNIVVSRGGRQRRYAFSRGAVICALFAAPAVAALYLGATAYLFFRDDMVASLMTRQARMQYAYEDRLAAMRAQLDKVTSRQLLDQDSFEGKMQSLINRQAQLETRTALVASISEKINLGGDAVGSIAAPPRPAPKAAPTAAPAAKGAPNAVSPAPQANSAPQANPAPTFQSVPPNAAPPGPEKPHPDGFELRSSADLPNIASSAARQEKGREQQQDNIEPAKLVGEATNLLDDLEPSTPARLDAIAQALDKVERRQVGALARLRAPATALVERLKTALAESGLAAHRLTARAPSSAMGGPFTPAPLDANASPFERQLNDVQASFASLENIRRVLPYVPLRRPLQGPVDITSSFGYRLDPFLGRSALHSGLDMRAETGSPVMATAGGKVVTAGYSGGYGNLVEIDHGSGIATRYGHLSAILVSEGQNVGAGAVIGRVGSTGRSTGPHLHYEVRIDDEAADPTRFIRAARLIAPLE